MIQPLLINLRDYFGDSAFIALMIGVGLAISIGVIPYATDAMVNAAAGLAGKYLGAQYRTLVINCSTNNPELITMLLALFLSGRQGAGGIATPLGSNFANIYLIFGVALLWLFARLWFQDRDRFFRLLNLLRKERRLVFWHVGVSIAMFLLSSAAYRALTYESQTPRWGLAAVALLCAIGVGLFVWLEAGLKRVRPEIFQDIDDEDHVASWWQLFLGTAGLMAACYLVNSMFEVSAELYRGSLEIVLGKSVFAAMHYFLGALITSLPELNVAMSNYRRVTSADLNTGLSSASASNMSNLAIAGIGGLLALLLL